MSGRRQKSRRVAASGEDETVGLAGWMYTDLLLGLAVVFLGSIGFVLAGRDAEVGGPGESSSPQATVSTSSTSSTTTTTTTTLPPEECTILYAPAENSRDGFYLSGLDIRDGDQLSDKFRKDLEERLEQENRLLAESGSFLRPFEFDDLEIGIAIATGGGGASYEGNNRAREMVQTLKTLFPNQLGQTAVRTQWRSSGDRPSEVDIEVFPTITGDCAILSEINS